MRRRTVHGPAQEDHRDRPSDGRVPAVRPGRRLPAEDRVQRVRHPATRPISRRTRPTARILDKPNGTGPYKLKEWSRGNRIVWTANDGYWGTKALTPNARVPLERPVGPAPRRAAVPAPSTASTTPAPTTSPTIQADSNLQFKARARASTPCSSASTTRSSRATTSSVRQAIAMGIDRERIVKNFYPAGSTVADYFTPCEIPFACEGDKHVDVRSGRGQAAPDRGRLPERLRDQDPVPRRGPWLRHRSAASSRPRSRSSSRPTSTSRHALDCWSPARCSTASPPARSTASAMIGWGADYPGPVELPRLPLRLGLGQEVRRPVPGHRRGAQHGRRRPPTRPPRTAAYTDGQQPDQAARPGVLHRPRRFRRRLQGRRRARLRSVFGGEVFASMKAGDRDTLVFMQNAEPLSLYCGDETDGESLRACEQSNESLYAYEVGGAAAVPALATECTANADSTTWTCTLRDGVKFHDGADLDANDVVLSYAVQWDTKHPLHIGRTGSVRRTCPACGVGSSTRPAGHAGTGIAIGSAVTVLTHRLRNDDRSGAPHSRRPLTSHQPPQPERVTTGRDPVHRPPAPRHDPGPARDHVRRLRPRAARTGRPLSRRPRRAGHRRPVRRLHPPLRPRPADPGPVRGATFSSSPAATWAPRSSTHGRSRRC